MNSYSSFQTRYRLRRFFLAHVSRALKGQPVEHGLFHYGICSYEILFGHGRMELLPRRIIGFAVHRGQVFGEALRGMFSEIVTGIPTPTYLSMDNDPHYLFVRWAPLLEALSINPIRIRSTPRLFQITENPPRHRWRPPIPATRHDSSKEWD